MLRLVALSLTAGAVLFSAPQVDAQLPRAGSVLVFPKHSSGSTPGSTFSIVSVTNTNLQPATPISFGGSTIARYTYVNVSMPSPENPFRARCFTFERSEFLTPGDTASLATSCHNATAPGSETGYLVVAAQDPAQFQTPWAFNHLIGSMTVVEPSGAAYSYDAIPFRSPLPKGTPTDLNGNGLLEFDGVEYEQTPGELMLDQFLSGVGGRLSLINMTGTFDDTNTVFMSVWNDNELPLTATRQFNCWLDARLTSISPIFSPAFLNSLPNDPTELDVDCDGDDEVETGWAILDSLDVSTPGGVPVANDGAMLGMFHVFGTDAMASRSLWASDAMQPNGAFGPAVFAEPGQHGANGRSLVNNH